MVQAKDQRLVLRYSQIISIEAQSHYLHLALDTPQAEPEIRARLQTFALRLPPQMFVQCHRSYLVNLAHIRRFTKNSLTMSNQKLIPVSQTYFTRLRTAFDGYYAVGGYCGGDGEACAEPERGNG